MFDPERVARVRCSVDERDYAALLTLYNELLALYNELRANLTRNAEVEAKLAQERMASENELDRMRNRISEAARDYDVLLALYSDLARGRRDVNQIELVGEHNAW